MKHLLRSTVICCKQLISRCKQLERPMRASVATDAGSLERLVRAAEATDAISWSCRCYQLERAMPAAGETDAICCLLLAAGFFY